MPALRKLQKRGSVLTSEGRHFEDLATQYPPLKQDITGLTQYISTVGQETRMLQEPFPGLYCSSDPSDPNAIGVARFTYSNQSHPIDFSPRIPVAFYPSPPPEGESRHINQKYTAEQGDFIIYAWHDRKIKWQRIKQEYAAMFGTTPERTVQGLQAWYYRMNQRIPVWDKDGWLRFENEDDLEPKHVSIKCRGQDKPMEPLGLAQRYPERAMKYSWVDPELKRRAQDWGKSHAQLLCNDSCINNS